MSYGSCYIGGNINQLYGSTHQYTGSPIQTLKHCFTVSYRDKTCTHVKPLDLNGSGIPTSFQDDDR